SLGTAHAFVDAIADAGADAVKFQTHIAAAESTPSEPFRVKFSRQDATRYDYWRRMEFSEDGWRGLAQHCADRGVLFISSPFSLEAVDLLERVGQPIWKVASGEVSNTRLLDRVLATGKPVLLSSGLSPVDSSTGFPVASTRSSSRVFETSPDATFQIGWPTRSSRSTASSENGDEMNSTPRSAQCWASPRHPSSLNSIRLQ